MRSLRIYVTADRTSEESAAAGTYEESGWIDWDRSGTDIYEHRHDVRPLISVPEGELTERAREIRDAIYQISSSWEGETGTYYTTEATIWDYATGDHWMYAIHVVWRDAHGNETQAYDFDLFDL